MYHLFQYFISHPGFQCIICNEINILSRIDSRNSFKSRNSQPTGSYNCSRISISLVSDCSPRTYDPKTPISFTLYFPVTMDVLRSCLIILDMIFAILMDQYVSLWWLLDVLITELQRGARIEMNLPARRRRIPSIFGLPDPG